ncbi:hypothetical protein GpartN1_g5212.t1 [Galdieria partita]|uniref:Methyltransferase type 11 domain-containing protein n=1 Tax=Galdieria partita TaxID=83374 RepID=A0A9C7URY6_9RHOD|nr:hypothetical protein GpartN1_g5212.t1 [Galdieria partita]
MYSDDIDTSIIWLPSPENEYEGDWLEESFVDKYYYSIQEEQSESNASGTKLFPEEETIVCFVQSFSLLLLDVGCGRKGSLSHVDWQHRPFPLFWLGVDKYTDTVCQFQVASKRPHIIMEGIVASAYALPFRDKVFDTILCQSVLHHCPTKYKRQLVWQNIYAACLLKQTFCIYLTVCAFEQTERRLASQDALVPDIKGRIAFYHFFTRKELEECYPHSQITTERDQHAVLLLNGENDSSSSNDGNTRRRSYFGATCFS